MTESDIVLLDPADAWNLMESDPSVLLVDVRSDMEFLMIGHPTGAVNVPWIDHPNWTVSADFVPKVRKLLLGYASDQALSQHAVLLICRSGNRSMDAAKALSEAGLGRLHVIKGGFEGPLDEHHHRSSKAGWRFAQLPWKQC